VHTDPSTTPQKTLGTLVARYGPRKRRWREAWIWPLPGFILSFALIITGLDWYYYGYTQYGPVAAQSWSQSWLAWGFLIGIFTLLLTIWQIFRTRVMVNLYRYGIETKLPQHPIQALRWEEISGIAVATIQDRMWGITLHIHHRITIQLNQHKPISLDDRIENLLELATRLKANLYPRLLPGLRARFKAGQALSFGPISIHANYIDIREKHIPWELVSRITVVSGHLIVDTHNQKSDHPKNIRVPIHLIPNLELLFQVLQRGLSE
jgi:hypothetical protein